MFRPFTAGLLVPLIALGALAGPVPPLPQPPATCVGECIANPSFEGYTCLGWQPPLGWRSYYPWQASVACSFLAYSGFVPPHGGLSVARFADWGLGSIGVVSSPMVATAGDAFEARAWYHAYHGGVSGLYIQFYEPPGLEGQPYTQGRLLLTVGTENAATTDWLEQNVTATAPHSPDVPVLLAYVLVYSCGPCEGVYYVDDASLRRL